MRVTNDPSVTRKIPTVSEPSRFSAIIRARFCKTAKRAVLKNGRDAKLELPSLSVFSRSAHVLLWAAQWGAISLTKKTLEERPGTVPIFRTLGLRLEAVSEGNATLIASYDRVMTESSNRFTAGC